MQPHVGSFRRSWDLGVTHLGPAVLTWISGHVSQSCAAPCRGLGGGAFSGPWSC